MTSRDYENPYRPVPVRIFNRLGRTGARLGLSDRLKVDALHQTAARRTGLTDFGDDGHRHALEVLVESITNEARLTPTGGLIQKSRLTEALMNRLRIEDLLKRHPEINDIDLGNIIVVTGLQRTGTTLLQRLLNSHPRIRGISGAEGLVPVLAADQKTDSRARKRRAALAQRTITYLAPDFMSIHTVEPDEPEEDVMLLDINFMSQSAEATMSVPSYSRWLEVQDHTPNYEYFRRVLKVLAWQHPRDAWVLKTPHHLEHLHAFLTVFPAATVVQTHRDPRVAVASFCSMVAHGRGIFSDRVDPIEIGRHWGRKTQRMVQLAMRARSKTPAGRFVDVSYYDLKEGPIAELARVCDLAGIDFDDAAEREAALYMAKNPQHRYGKHHYRLQDFGLDEPAVDEAFAAYREAYAVPFESP